MATNVVTTVALRPDPINMTCPRCQANIQTATKTETSSTGWGLGICLAIFGCVLFSLSLVQFCTKSLKNRKRQKIQDFAKHEEF